MEDLWYIEDREIRQQIANEKSVSHKLMALKF
jgi:hypothetical protein